MGQDTQTLTEGVFAEGTETKGVCRWSEGGYLKLGISKYIGNSISRKGQNLRNVENTLKEKKVFPVLNTLFCFKRNTGSISTLLT